jgi:hypothetical protein
MGMVSKLTLLKISLLLPALFSSFDEPKIVSFYHSSLTATLSDRIHYYDSIPTHSSSVAQSTDPGGSGRIDINIRSTLS